MKSDLRTAHGKPHIYKGVDGAWYYRAFMHRLFRGNSPEDAHRKAWVAGCSPQYPTRNCSGVWRA